MRWPQEGRMPEMCNRGRGSWPASRFWRQGCAACCDGGSRHDVSADVKTYAKWASGQSGIECDAFKMSFDVCGFFFYDNALSGMHDRCCGIFRMSEARCSA